MLTAGSTATFSVTVLVNANVAGGTSLTNSATGTSTTPDPTPGNNTGTAITPVTTSADLVVTKTAAANVTAGTNLVYTITVINNGPSDAQAVALADTLPAGTTFVSQTQTAGPAFTLGNAGNAINDTIATLANGASATFSVTVLVSASDPSGAVLTNSATASSTTSDPNPGNNTGTATTTVTTSADVSITKTAAATAFAGNNLTYTITITNNGPSDAQSVVVSDTLPPFTTFVSQSQTSGPVFTLANAANVLNDTIATLANGASATISVVVNVSTGAANGSTLVNIANVTSPTPDPLPGNNSGTATTTVSTSSDMAITKTVDIPTPVLGTNVVFTVTLTNNGPSDATNVVVSDVLPAGLTYVTSNAASGTYAPGTGLWTIPALISLSSTTLTVTATAATVGAKTNTATILSADQPDAIPGNNSASATVTPQYPELSVSKTDNVAVVQPGNTLTYVLTFQNNGNRNATNVVITETVPANTTFVAAGSTPGWIVAGANMTLNVGTVVAGAPARTATFVVHVNNTVPVGTTQIANTASIDDDHTNGPDPIPLNNTTSDIDALIAAPDFVIVKSDGGKTVLPGNVLVYTLTYSNAGSIDATGVVVSETVPANMTFVAVQSSIGWSFADGDPAGTTGKFTLGALAAGGSGTLTFAARLNAAIPAGTVSVSNTASIDDDHTNGVDPTPLNDTSTITTKIPTSDIQVKKSVSDRTPGPLDTITYTINVTNLGPDDDTGVSATDVLPAGITLVSFAPSKGTYVPASGLWTIGALANGEIATLTVQATVNLGNTGVVILNVATKATTDNYDPNLNNDTDNAPIVPLPCPIAIFNSAPLVSSTTVSLGIPVNFFANATESDGRLRNYLWDFGDGTTGTGPTPSHTYATAGQFNVSVTVTNNCGQTIGKTAVLTVAPATCDILRPAGQESALNQY